MGKENKELQLPLLSGVLLVSREPTYTSILKRITSHIAKRMTRHVATITDAEIEIMRREPDAVIVDVSDFSSIELERKLSPFVLQLPGWVKTFFVDKKPTPSRVLKARNMGVHGVLKAPLSHFGITTLLASIADDQFIEVDEKGVTRSSRN
ncbi:MAG: hypothetical protein J5J00_03580 [Deltaproteobacteria bacterium]|nr:hypothetical protein [Deltaproteobacteria bacterium]